MQAIQVRQTGGPEALTLVDVPVPQLKPDEALVQLKAVGVNYIDVYFREGRYPAVVPFIDGQEGAGIITEVGSAFRDLKPGDRVAYTGRLGSYAEYAAVAADRLVPLPPKIDFHTAAALMLQGMTAHYLLKSTYPVRAGETILVHAAAGGMGLLLVQIAKRIGARVIGTAGTEEKAALARKAGAADVIIYTRQDFEAETKRLTDGRGVHVIYDGVGKDTFAKDLNLLRPRGYLVLYGASSGAVPPFDPIVLTQKGSLFLTRPSLGHYIATREELLQRASEVFAMVTAGDLHVHIGRTYPLTEAQQAHRDLEGRRTTGKLLLIP